MRRRTPSKRAERVDRRRRVDAGVARRGDRGQRVQAVVLARQLPAHAAERPALPRAPRSRPVASGLAGLPALPARRSARPGSSIPARALASAPRPRRSLRLVPTAGRFARSGEIGARSLQDRRRCQHDRTQDCSESRSAAGSARTWSACRRRRCRTRRPRSRRGCEPVEARRNREVARHAADQEARVAPGVLEDPGQHRRSGGLAVRSGDGEHLPARAARARRATAGRRRSARRGRGSPPSADCRASRRCRSPRGPARSASCSAP